jgi:hypothetical protein
MRILTNAEIGAVAGGMDEVSEITVSGGSGGGGGGFGGGDGYSGGGAPGSGGGAGEPPPPGHEYHVSAGGHGYLVNDNVHLSASQLAVVDKIIDYGFSHGYTPGSINVMIGQAYYESSLGSLRNNPTNPDVAGIFQYDANTWSDLGHGATDRFSDAAQIAAMYQDLDKYWVRYENNINASAIPSGMSFAQYFEVKHHLGNNSENFTSPIVADYGAKERTLGFTVTANQ